MGQLQSLALNLLYHHGENVLPAFFVLGQEDEARSVFPFFGHGNALKQYEFVRNLEHDACSVARFAVGSLGASVAQMFQNLEGVVNKLMAFAAVYVHHHAHSACVVFVNVFV